MMTNNKLSKICGYDILKFETFRQRDTLDIDDDTNYLMIFLKEFPELSEQFFSGKEIWVKPEKKYLDFLENILDKRFSELEKNHSWKTEYSEEIIDFIRKGGYISFYTYRDTDYEINIWGNRSSQLTVRFLTFYNLLKEKNNDFGIKITPKKGLYD
ncbi:hypothetical protein [uncultured Dokdonia sp.]|uniref:hypothetical protein n=1 Tax=uncultured Dokdonia sp. TaxID=575653 RepID=UPI0026354E8D|nr:hypothetical protein [uncultured Dokdonia sp.]